jgi:hypothetical protein
VIRIVGVFDKKMSPLAVMRSGDWGTQQITGSARGDVHRDFEAKAKVGRSRGLPLHVESPKRG